MRRALLLVVLSGCHLVFGLQRDDDVPEDAASDAPADAAVTDRDQDGIDDLLDTCIATATDLAADDDGDTIPNASDPCPFNAAHLGNSDGDAIPDACDPFTSTPGDHPLCVMTFADTALANQLWLPRAPDIGWGTNPGDLHAIPVANEIATVIAATSLEGANVTTYQGVFTFVTHGRPGGLTLWLRADPAAASSTDVGCHVESTNGLTPVTIGVTTVNGFRDQKTLAFLPGTSNGLRIQGSLATVGQMVLATCRFTLNSSPVTTSVAMVPLVPGTVGVTTDRWDTKLSSLYITDRP